MYCGNCGKEAENNNQKFCTYCGAPLIESCPNCGAEILDDAKFCTSCGYNLENLDLKGDKSKNTGSIENNSAQEDNIRDNEMFKSREFMHTQEDFKANRKNNISKILLIGLIGIIFVSLIIPLLRNIIPQLHNNIEESFKPKASNCEASATKDLVIQIFRDNNEYYKDIDPSSISSIELIYPAVTAYDKELDKYSCTGTLVMKSNKNGFIPSSFEYGNKYYDKINNNWYDYKTLEKYTKYEVQLKYDTQISEGSLLVQTKDINQKFSCDEACGRISNQKYQKEIEKQEQIKKENLKEQEEERKKIQKLYKSNSAKKNNSNSNNSYYNEESWNSDYDDDSSSEDDNLKEEAENDLF